MKVRILNNEVSPGVVVSKVVPVGADSNVLATYSGDTAFDAVDAAWGWADRNGHVVVEA